MSMNETAINWTSLTWSPWSGCAKVSAGCKYCYADTLAENKRGTAAFPNGFDLTLRPHKLTEPLREKRPSLIFTSSMTDVFFEEVPVVFREAVFDTIARTPQHRYQILTKRPHLARAWFDRHPCPANVWMGTTVEDARVLDRLEHLRAINARVRFVSAEPLIGGLGPNVDLRGIDWLIGGGESGLHLMRPEVCRERGLVARVNGRWAPTERGLSIVRQLRDACIAQNVAFWFKQWGGPRPTSGGRTIDGATWDQMPHVEGAMPEGYVHAERQTKHMEAAKLALEVVS
jgi:protein gp37